MLNKCMFIGNLGADPEVRTTQNGTKIVNLNLAVTERWKGQDGQRQERTEWVRIVIFNERIAEVAERYLHKGSKLFVEGSLQTRKWTDQQGVDQYRTEVVLAKYKGDIQLLDARGGGDGHRAQQQSGGSQYAGPGSDLDSEPPF